MDIFESLTSQINSKTDDLIRVAEDFRLDMLRKIEDARNNEILAAIKTLSTRLSAIEYRLPPLEDDNG